MAGGLSETGRKAEREILGPRALAIVAVAVVLEATINPIATYFSFEFAGFSFREQLDNLPPSLGASTGFGYLLAALAALVAYRTMRTVWMRRLLGVIALFSAVVAAYGLFEVWHFLTIKFRGLDNENQTISVALEHGQWQLRGPGVMWGSTAVVLAAITFWLTFPVAARDSAAPRGDDDDEPESIDMTPVK